MAYRKCKQCGTKTDREAGIIAGLSFFCSNQCRNEWGIANASKLAEKAKEKREKTKRKEIKEAKKKLKKPIQFKNEAQAAFNKYIRIRDMGKPCPSCDRTIEEIEVNQGWKHGGAWDAGHFRSRGAANQLRFRLDNVHRQCKSCNGGSNKFDHVRETVSQKYEKTMREMYGDERTEFLMYDNSTRVFTIEYLERIKRIFNKRARLYQKLFR